MRYIDGDALYDKFQNLSYDDWNQGVGTTWANAYAEAADVVDDMPTEDVAPVRRGRWVKMSDADGYYFCCSECGEELYREVVFNREFDLFPTKKSINKTNFCPFCGAKMER